MYIFYIEFAPFLLARTLAIKRTKGIEIGELFFTTHLNTISSNVFLTLKFMNFEDLALTKICSSLCGEEHECILYMI
jgi:hypothetical protein